MPLAWAMDVEDIVASITVEVLRRLGRV